MRRSYRERRVLCPRISRIPTAVDVGLPDVRAKWQIERALQEDAWRRRQLSSTADGCTQLAQEADAAQVSRDERPNRREFLPGLQ